MRAHRLSTFAAIGALLWLNLYWCREIFFLDHFGQMQSIRGFWEGLGRLGHFSFAPQWWPYSYNGMPLEYAYAPAVPTLLAVISKLTGWSIGRAFGVIAGFVFCAGPVALFWMARETTHRLWWSFIAALTYSLLTPSLLLVPDAEFRWGHVHDSLRIILMFGWDEVPHQLALALILLSAAAAVQALRWRAYWWGPAGVFLALAMFASPFAGVAGAFFFLLAAMSWDQGELRSNIIRVSLCGLAAYLVVSPFYPPSLIQVIRQNADLSPDYGWTSGSIGAVLAVAAGTTLLFLLTRRWPPHLRYFLLLTFVFFTIPFLQRWNLHFVPQPGRYRVELDAALVLLGVFSAAKLLDRTPPAVRAVLAIAIVIPAAVVVKIHRVDSKHIFRASDIHESIEYQVASWLQSNAGNQRVMASGSIGFWMNRFTSQQQFMGGSFTTIPTLTMQIATWGVVHIRAESGRGTATRWLQAYGVDTLVVPGADSPESWKQFVEPKQYDALLPLLWRERDTSIYSVPRTYRSLASFVPPDRAVRRRPVSFFQLDEIEPYVAAMEDPASQAEWQWLDNNSGVARGKVAPGRVLSLHITYHPGWKAFVHNSAVPVVPDALEQILVDPKCSGPCEVKLVYNGGVEARVTRIASSITLAAAAVLLMLSRRKPRSGS